MKKRVLIVLGTRPEAVKFLPVIKRFRERDDVALHLALTGQHRDMVGQIFEPFDIVGDDDLAIMEPGQTLNQIVHKTISRLDGLIETVEPDMVMVQGDTTSAFVAGLAAFHRRTKLAHLEAGLRSGDRFHPYPEEANRRMIGCLADLHLAPTAHAQGNLLREGVEPSSIVVTGNTTIDAMFEVLALQERQGQAIPDEVVALGERPLVLITAHRRESYIEPAEHSSTPAKTLMEEAFYGIAGAADDHPDVGFVYPVHLNPRVREPAARILGGRDNVVLLDPLPYIPFIRLMARAQAILSDSGGVQEEAPSIGVPVLVLRKTTERPEGIASGDNVLVGTDPDRIRAELTQALARPKTPSSDWPCGNPFGDGCAADRVCRAVLHALGAESRPEPFAGDGIPSRSTSS